MGSFYSFILVYLHRVDFGLKMLIFCIQLCNLCITSKLAHEILLDDVGCLLLSPSFEKGENLSLKNCQQPLLKK